MFAPIRAICLALAGVMLSACALASIQGDGSQVAPARPVSRLAAYVIGPAPLVASFQADIAIEAARRGLAAENASVLFPPTRRYADAEIRHGLAARSIDSVLMINIGDTGVQREYAGTILQGRLRVSSGGGEAAEAAVNGYPRETTFSARLLDGVTGRQVWEGFGQVGGSGFFPFGGSATLSESVSESVAYLFDDLQAKGVISTPDAAPGSQPESAQ